jgi:hypothetical protein
MRISRSRYNGKFNSIASSIRLHSDVTLARQVVLEALLSNEDPGIAFQRFDSLFVVGEEGTKVNGETLGHLELQSWKVENEDVKRADPPF